jgi:hypothetical protein
MLRYKKYGPLLNLCVRYMNNVRPQTQLLYSIINFEVIQVYAVTDECFDIEYKPNALAIWYWPA